MSTSSREGSQRLGKYELRERLGHGGAAEVWKAFDTELERFVAIKLLHANLRTDPEFMARFSREARFIAGLHHPNIVQIYDFQTSRSLETDAPIAYMVMDYVEGETLAQYISKTSRVGQFPPPAEIVRLFASISKALDYAHQEGMIHRDIKPANILLDKRHAPPNSIGEPVLTDFGIAKIVGASSETVTGMWLGTPLYVSPEQAQGYPATKLSDIYSLGVILYEICTGVSPFRAESLTAILLQQVNAAPPLPAQFNPAIPPALTTVILRAMAKDPAERFHSASALTAAVAEAFHLAVPEGLSLADHASNDLMEATYLSPRQPDPSPYMVLQRAQQSQPSVPMGQQFTEAPAPQAAAPITRTSNTPAYLSPPATAQNTQDTISPPVSALKPPPRPGRTWRGNLIAWVAIVLVLAISIPTLIILLGSSHASPAIVGTLTFTNSGQYDTNTTVGYNDIITLSLHSLTTPQTGNAFFAWLRPDPGDDTTSPLMLGNLSVKGGNANLVYNSPTHSNLLAQYSRVLITEEPANSNPTNPSPDSTTWRWEGSFPNTPNPGDPNHYSLLDHLRHLLAKDPILQDNGISGGLALWMTRNISKVEEWSSAAQGQWNQNLSDGDANLIHNQMLRILDYLDGQTYVALDVPAGSPWLVDPVAGKLGLLNYTQNQNPPGYLPHVNTHLTGLTEAPGHTAEQEQLAVQVDKVIARMINDLTTVHKDAVQLVQRSNAQLAQADTLTTLNEMVSLTTEANSGWFDPTTNTNVGGSIWLGARLQQLATISLTASQHQ